MMPRRINLSSFDPVQWRRRAHGCRKVAEQLDEPARTKMLGIAQSYEELAAMAEKKKWVPAPELKRMKLGHAG
jgi:hypothetical protein